MYSKVREFEVWDKRLGVSLRAKDFRAPGLQNRVTTDCSFFCEGNEETAIYTVT